MCTVTEYDIDIDNLNIEQKCRFDLKGCACKKCSQHKANVVLRVKDAYCRECFLKYATHKFRSTLGKSKLMKPNDRVLLATSGSLSSSTLLHLVAEGLSEQNHKRFLFSSLAVYIDEGAVLNLTNQERIEIASAISKDAEVLGYSIYVVQLSNYMDLKHIRLFKLSDKDPKLNLNDEKLIRDDEQMKIHFASLKSLTAKEDLLSKLRHNLLIAAAKELNCNKLLLAENGSQLAVQLMTNISLGRGSNLPLDVGFCDNRDPHLMVLRPLKEFMSKEIAFYCVFNGMKGVTLPSLSTKTSRMASIRRLTEDFLFQLNKDFPSTLSAVIKTGDKLIVRQEGSRRCLLCKGQIEHLTRQSSSLQATKFSIELISKIQENCIGSRASVAKEEDSDANHDFCSQNKIEDNFSERPMKEKYNLEEHTCYGCRHLIIDSDTADELIEALLSSSLTCDFPSDKLLNSSKPKDIIS